MRNKFLCVLLIVFLIIAMLCPGYASSESGNQEYDSDYSPGYSLGYNDSGQEAEENINKDVVQKISRNLTAIMTDSSHIFDYVDKSGFEKSNHIARLEPLEDLNTYVFANEDGTTTMYMLDENVKYVTSSGEIREKDISLIQKENTFVTEENDLKISIPIDIKEGITLSFGEYEILMKVCDSSAKAEYNKETNTITYKNIFGDGIDLRYIPTLNGLKEEIILNSKSEINEFEFEIETELQIFEDEKGMYFAKSKDDEIRFDLGKIFTYDAEEKSSYGQLKAEKTDKGYIVTIVAEKEFLESEETIYPVVVDPSFTVSENSGGTAIQDASLYYMVPAANIGGDSINTFGTGSVSTGNCRTAIRLYGLETNEIFSALRTYDITSVKLNMKYSSGDQNTNINLYRITGSPIWTEYTVTWNNVGTYDNIAYSIGNFSMETAAIDITGIATMWKGMGATSYCLLGMISGDEADSYVKSYSSNYATSSYRPYLIVTYNGGITLDDSYIELDEEQGTYISASFSPLTNITVSWSASGIAGIISVTPDSDNANMAFIEALHAGTAYAVATYIDSNNYYHLQYCQVDVRKPDGIYYIINNNSNKYLTTSGEIANGSNIYQNDIYSTTYDVLKRITQMWKIEYIGNEYYSIRAYYKLDKGLAISEINNQYNAEIFYIGNTNSVQNTAKWKIKWGQGGYEISNLGVTSKTMLVENSSTDNFANVIAGPKLQNSSSDNWSLQYIYNPPEGIYFYDTTLNAPVEHPTIDIAPNETINIASLPIVAVVYCIANNSQDVIWDVSTATSTYADVNQYGTVTGIYPNRQAEIIASRSDIEETAYYYLHVSYRFGLIVENDYPDTCEMENANYASFGMYADNVKNGLIDGHMRNLFDYRGSNAFANDLKNKNINGVQHTRTSADDVDLVIFTGHGYAKNRNEEEGLFTLNSLHFGYTNTGNPHQLNVGNTSDANFTTSDAIYFGYDAETKWLVTYTCNFLNTYQGDPNVYHMLDYGGRLIMGLGSKSYIVPQEGADFVEMLMKGKSFKDAYFDAANRNQNFLNKSHKNYRILYYGQSKHGTLDDTITSPLNDVARTSGKIVEMYVNMSSLVGFQYD